MSNNKNLDEERDDARLSDDTREEFDQEYIEQALKDVHIHDDNGRAIDVTALLQSLLNTSFGEVNLDEDYGIPHMDSVLNKQLDIDGVARVLREGLVHNVVIACGAGVSVSAGIPDFRSPGSGLYHNLSKLDLPYPEAIFDIDYFRKNPKPFFMLSKELYPTLFKPTPTHYFMKLLHEKKLLRRIFTQNIDGLERMAGIPEDMLVEAHGTFVTAHCLNCEREYSHMDVKDEVLRGDVPKCRTPDCQGIIKPDIVFFGEQLPNKFFKGVTQDLPACDLLIIIGTSLSVYPFAGVIDQIPRNAPRILVNKEAVGQATAASLRNGDSGLLYNFPGDNYRDVFLQGDCDDVIARLADLCGWKKDMDRLMNDESK